MKRAGLMILMAALVILTGAFAYGTDTFGVPAYPGGTYDPQTVKALKEMMQLDAACFRTKDSVSSVVDFYKKQGGLKLLHADEKGAFFKKGNIDITVQTPWMDMNTGKMNKDTLISIVRTE
jgi:hypothetical protein